MVRGMLRPLRELQNYLRLPAAAKAERHLDSMGLPAQDPGIERGIEEGVAWLGRAQDHSISADGGAARQYSLITGWGASYPETTGYIIPTMLAYAELRRNVKIRQRAKQMLDWLVSIQSPEGGFQGGTITAAPAPPVTFNTGQILLGLASGVQAFGEYRQAMCRAADWLVQTQDTDGCWRKYPTVTPPPARRSMKLMWRRAYWRLPASSLKSLMPRRHWQT